ncbi:RPA-interacting protein, central domain [Sesbania bispinosa]|nr:RPA-interacting protein, central domain [Sesbania bispinosa]
MEENRESSVRQKNGTASTATATATRPSLKSDSQFSRWKQKLRENCYKRVREDRTRLLWKMRSPSSPSSNQQDIVRSAFKDIVSDEFNKMKHSSSLHDIPISDSHMGDLLWDYEGPHTTYQGEDCQDILLEMQRIFYEDLKSQSPIQGLESGIETWEDEVDEYLASAVYEHMQLNADEAHRDGIWCPICKQGELKDNHNLIYCNHCELQLNKANEVLIFLPFVMTLD